MQKQNVYNYDLYMMADQFPASYVRGILVLYRMDNKNTLVTV